jgi:hypothetical protein
MIEARFVDAFAEAGERLNEYARSIRDSKRFMTVRTGADIRRYDGAWRLEKWMEAELDQQSGLWAAWWIELGPSEAGLVIESHLSVSPDVLHIELPTRRAETADELEDQLRSAVSCLVSALDENPAFSGEVHRLATAAERAD